MNPYALTKETVVLIGMAEGHRDLAPWDNPDVELWGINESYANRHRAKKLKKSDPDTPFFRRWSRWFQMHPRWDFMRAGNFNHQNHPLWMMNQKGTCMACWGKGKIAITGKPCADCAGTGEYDPAVDRRTTDFPIYTLEDEPEVPGSAKYPLDEVVGLLGKNAEHARWFTNSFGYMMGLAILLGAKRIESYGFEMSSSTEYGDQKPNAAFWAGVCMGLGVEFVIPSGCALLGIKDPLYGYEKTPGFTPMHAEIMANGLQKALGQAQAELNQVRGTKKSIIAKMQMTKGQSNDGTKALQREFNSVVAEELQRINAMNALFGAFQQMKRVQADVNALRSVSEVGYMDVEGKKHMIELAEFEAEAREAIERATGEEQHPMLTTEDLYGA